MEEPLIDRWPEPADHDRCNQKRHEKVEVLGRRASGLSRQCDFLRITGLGFDFSSSNWRNSCAIRLRAFFHLSIGAKENRLALVQENDPVGEFLGEPHVVGDHDAGQVQLTLEPRR